MSISSLPISHRAVIPEDYLDEMGHMNVMWYSHLFDRATWAFLASVGMTRAYFDANQTGAFALEAHVRYLSEVRVGHSVTLRSRVVGRSASRFHFMHFMQNESTNRLAATSEFVGAHIDMAKRKVAEMPDEISAAIDQRIREHAILDWAPPLCNCMKP